MANAKEIGITIRFDPEKIEAVDAHVERLKLKAGPGIQVTRTDAIRNLLDKALAEAGRSR